MVEVPVRPPRFLGEKVPYREQSMQEQIQTALPGYTVEDVNGQFIAKASPVEYKSYRKGDYRETSTYSPHELVISKEGEVLKEKKFGIYTEDYNNPEGKGDTVGRWSPYVSEETDYTAQTRRTYGTRDLKSGRETVQLTSEVSGGQYRENRIIHQDSKEYEIAKEQHDLFQNFVGQGMSYAQARQLSRATEVQREAYFKDVAKQRTQQFSLQGKAVTLQHQAQRQFSSEYKTQAQKYATDIVRKQQVYSSPTTRTDMGTSVVLPTEKPDFTKGAIFPSQNPASPTTRTDKGTFTPLLYQKQSATMTAKPEFMTSSYTATEEQARRQQQLASDNFAQKFLDTGIFRLEETKFQDIGFAKTPLVTDIIAPATIGAGSIIIGTVSHPVRAVKSMLDPIGMAQGIQAQASELTATKGEVYSMSYLGGTVVGAEVLGRSGSRAFDFVKDVYVKAGAERVPAERVFSREVLEEGKTFPTVRSTAEALERFNKEGKSYNLDVAKNIVAHPEAYSKPVTTKSVALESPVLKDLRRVIPAEDLVFTGGVARRIITGDESIRIRDVDVVVESSMQGREMAYKLAERYPEKYEVIQHEKYPQIYKIRERKTGKVKIDFDPRALAEEGQIKRSEDIIEVQGQKVVSPEVQLKSKAMQIVAGKTRGLKQGKNIQVLNPEIPIFEEKVVVSTVSPTALKGRTVGMKVEKVGLEDPGIYVTPKGEASPYFTGIEAPETTYSLNPFKNFGVPTVTEFAINKVTTYPKSVVVKPGFKQLAEFQEANVGKGVAYITKRSQVGTGDLPRQKFFLEEPTVMSGKTVEPGWRVEAGTSEIEAVIGQGESFAYTPKTFLGKIKGFEQYTVYKGRAVAVRQGKVLTETSLGAVSPGSKVLPGSTVRAGQEAMQSLVSGQKVVTPLSSVRAVPYGSVKKGYVQKEVGFKMEEVSPSKAKSSKPLVFSSEPVESSRSVEVSTGVSKTRLRESVASSSKSSFKSIRVPGVSRLSSQKGSESIGSFSSGRSFGGSSRGGSSSGRSGGSSGGSYGAGQDIPKEIVRSYPKPPTEERKKKGQFSVEVRKKGQFKTLAITETPQEAFRIGMQNVKLTASASLRVKPIGTSEKVTNVGKSVLPLGTFYESKKEPDVFIQRREKRISTFGEKAEITVRGLQAIRHKGLFGG